MNLNPTQRELVLEQLDYDYPTTHSQLKVWLPSMPTASIRRTLHQLAVAGQVKKGSDGYVRV